MYGPVLSIGDPAHGGILYKPVIAGFAIESHFPDPTGSYCPNCSMSGFIIGSSNLTAQLTFQGHMASLTVGGALARFWTNTLGSYTGFAEYNPVIGRTLTYSSPALTNNFTWDGVNYSGINAYGFSETFQDSDGTQYIFSDPGFVSNMYPGCELLGTPACAYSLPVSRIIKPNGDTLNYYYFIASYPQQGFPFVSYSLLSVVSNRGYIIRGTPSGLAAMNLTVESCNPIGPCTPTHTWPTMSYAVAPPPNVVPVPLSFTDSQGKVTTISHPAVTQGVPQEIIAITSPAGRVETFTYDTQYSGKGALGTTCLAIYTANNNAPGPVPCPFQHLLSYNDGLNTWNYSTTFGNHAGQWITTTIQRTDPFGNKRTTLSYPPSGQIVSDTDELGRTTTIGTVAPFQPNEGRVLSITYPEGNSKLFNNYDARGNVWQEVDTPKPLSGLPNRITGYVYPTTCGNWKTCNRPTSVTDPNGNVTTLTYDTNAGALLTEIMPAVNGVNPVKRLSYTPMYAWVSNGSGGYTSNSTAIYLLTETRTCMTTATVNNACQGGSTDEVVTDYYYGPQSGPNNLLLRGVSVTASGTTRTTCNGYDTVGNKISETKPKAGITTCP
jgi:YD repeat-containing protein